MKMRPGGRGKQSTLTQEETWQEHLLSSPEIIAKQIELFKAYKNLTSSSAASRAATATAAARPTARTVARAAAR